MNWYWAEIKSELVVYIYGGSNLKMSIPPPKDKNHEKNIFQRCLKSFLNAVCLKGVPPNFRLHMAFKKKIKLAHALKLLDLKVS